MDVIEILKIIDIFSNLQMCLHQKYISLLNVRFKRSVKRKNSEEQMKVDEKIIRKLKSCDQKILSLEWIKDE